MRNAYIIKHLRDDIHFRKLRKRIANDYKDPLIIIGMHRSGTTMVTRLLRKHGMYYGNVLDINSEAVEFQHLNDSLLGQSNSSWKNVDGILDLRDRRSIKGCLDHLVRERHQLWNGFFLEFGSAGKETSVHKQLPSRPKKNRLLLNWPKNPNENIPWGWKDPRTTLTLAIWLELFPNARVLHVIRNGIDVALSLWSRCIKTGCGLPECVSKEFCFKLWEYYVNEGLQWRRQLGGRYLEIQYEQFISSPSLLMKEILAHAGLDRQVDQQVVSVVRADKFDPKRWSEHPELITLASQSQLFNLLGYSKYISRAEITKIDEVQNGNSG